MFCFVFFLFMELLALNIVYLYDFTRSAQKFYLKMYININGFKLFIFEIKSDIHFKNEIIKVNNMFVPVGPSKKIV